MSKPIHQLSIAEAVRQMEIGELTAKRLTLVFLERIKARNDAVRAFVAHDADLALREAAAVDSGKRGGYLKGIPFAVKDTIQTADYPTAYGSPIYEGYQAGRDAGCVAKSREEGAVLLGKVATGEFATQTPGRARNPLNLGHTPGGSSSGSAAAVADGMAMAAWGSQTTGSIIRPAVYCGVVGYKPSFGLITTAGVSVLSPLQDTVGVLTRTVQDAASFVFGVHGSRVELQRGSRPLRLGVCTSSQWEHARPETIGAIERLIARAAAAGSDIRRIPLPDEFESLVALQGKIVAYDARHALAHENLNHSTLLSPRLAARISAGLDMDVEEYIAASRTVAECRHRVRALFNDVDALIYPAAEGEAEAGIQNSGSPRFGALWTLLHLPTVSFPIGRGPSNLPLGVQLVGDFGDDIALLKVADAMQLWADY